MKIFVSILVSLLATAAMATEPTNIQPAAECVSKSEMQQIASHFRQFANLANADFCNNDSKEWHLISSLMFMRQTAFQPDMPLSKDELFTGKFAKDWYGYFIGRINNLEIVDDCPKGVIAYVYMFGGKTMYTCPMALTKMFSSLDRASVMMHEARHMDGFPHITCSRGARKGIQGACDKKISDGGSYAVTVETYAQLSKYAVGIHPAMKAYAKSSSIVYADEAFETPVRIERSENLLALTRDQNFFEISSKDNSVKQLGQAVAAGKIVRRGQHMILFPQDKTIKAQYVFANNEGTIEQSPSDFITEYNAQTPAQKENLADLHIGAQWTARVYKTNIVFACDPKSATLNDLKLPAGETAANLIYPDGYARDRYTAQLVTTSGNVLDIGCTNKQASIKASTMRLDQKFDRMNKAGGVVYGLAQGQLFTVDSSNRSTPVTTELDGQLIEIVARENFSFFNAQ